MPAQRPSTALDPYKDGGLQALQLQKEEEPESYDDSDGDTPPAELSRAVPPSEDPRGDES